VHFEQNMKALDDCLRRDATTGPYETRVAPALGPVDLCKAGDRSALASMNQLAFQVKCDLLEMGHPLPVVNRRLNRMTMSKLKYRYSAEEFSAFASRSRA
jgi:hypothetical protein